MNSTGREIKIEEVKVDMRLSVVKPLSAKWKTIEEVASRPCEIKKKDLRELEF